MARLPALRLLPAALLLATAPAFAQDPADEPALPTSPTPTPAVDPTRVDPLPEPLPPVPAPLPRPPVTDDGSVDATPATTQPPAPEPEPLTSSDADFLAAAIAGGEREIAASALARTAAADEEIREFAAMLEREHREANADLDVLRAGTTAPRSTADAAAADAALSALRGLPSDRFDAEWLAWQAREHAQAIALFQRAANDPAHSEPVRRQAAAMLPRLQLHATRVAELRRGLADDAADAD